MLAAKDSNLKTFDQFCVGVGKEEYPEEDEQQEAYNTKRVTDLTTTGMKTDVNLVLLC